MASLPQYLMGNTGLDFEPLERGIARYQQNRELQRRYEMDQQRLGMEQTRLGWEGDRQPGLLRHQDLQNSQLQNIVNNQPDQLRADLAYKQAQTGHTNAQTNILIPAQAAQMRQHGNYYDAASKAALQKADNGIERNDILKKKVMGEFITRFGSPHITQDVWDRGNQPGGFIYATFGGPVPFEQRGYVLAQARQRVNAPPDVGALLDSGLSPKDIEAGRYHQQMESIYGRKPGFRYERLPDGSTVLKPFQEPDTAGERNGAIIARTGLKNLDDAERLLNQAGLFERLAGDRWTVPGTKSQVGGFGDAGRGFKAAEMAILDLNFALSGKSVSNKEREDFMRLYMPSSTDSAETRGFKMRKIREYFGTVLDARKRGATDEQIGGMYRGFIDQGSQPQPQPGQRPAGPAPTQPGGAPNVYKNRYGLE